MAHEDEVYILRTEVRVSEHLHTCLCIPMLIGQLKMRFS